MIKNGFILFISCVALLAACINTSRTSEKQEIAILKHITHPALDELEKAYIEQIESLLSQNDSLKNKYYIKKYNANGSSTSANTIAKSFEYKNVALILTIATPPAIEVANIPSDIPHVYGAVADPEGAKIIPSHRSTGIQNSGEAIIREALTFIQSVWGEKVKIGTIYNPKEQNSVYVQNLMKNICRELGVELKQAITETTSQLNGITNSLCKDVDIIYSANDNNINSGVSTITAVTSKYNKPFVIGDLSTLKDGALFAVGLKYSSMGIDLANMSYGILLNKSIESYPPQAAPKPEIWLNKKIAKELNFNLDENIMENFNIVTK
ncbi:MAG: ABC transporter substrate-binding protein [Tannerellaceae bacterium]|jgi:putative ABC transport system substrate-binding protein|nr:ABC transporter substrate-binding protein [Tannerellaceae bacterium]